MFSRELQQKDLPVAWPIPVVSPVQPTTTPEVAALINEELPDDSSDEEYKPYDDNVVSSLRFQTSFNYKHIKNFKTHLYKDINKVN